MTFIPPKVDQNVWATYVEGRSPKFKVHASRGNANLAIGNHYPHDTITLYHLESGEWAVSEVWERPKVCDRCHGTLMHSFYGGRAGFYPKSDPESRDKPAFTRAILCYTCYERANYRVNEARKEAYERKQLAQLQEKYPS